MVESARGRMNKMLVAYLKKAKYWQIVLITILASELMTLALNFIQIPLWYEGNPMSLLLVGAIDALVVPLTVSPFIIYAMKYVLRIEETNERLAQEISEKQLVQDALQKAKADWEESFNIINDAITIHDADFNIIRANHAAEELLDLPALTISRQKCYASYHGTDCPPQGCPSCETLKSGTASVTELYEPKLGKYIEIKALPRKNDSGQIVGLVHVVRDISSRKTAEEKMRVAHRMMTDILEHAPFGMYVVGSNGRVEYVNPAMLLISDTSAKQFLGVDIFALPGYRALGLDEKIRKVIAGEGFFYGPVTYASHFGGKTTIRNFIGVPLESTKGTRALIIVQDVTEQAKIAEEQRKLQEELVQSRKMESIGQLAGGIAHDFNNMLSVIIGYCEMATSSLPGQDPLRDKLDMIREAGERAAGLTQQLLAFSRKQVLRMQPINLAETVQGLLTMLRRVIREDIDLTLTANAPVPDILADPVQIQQVLMNLALNAHDAIQGSGRIHIGIEEVVLDEKSPKRRTEQHPGTYVQLRFSDSGIGMEPETMAHIFEPFFTTKEVGKGTGLGLATVYGIVKQHQGYVYVESVLGMGTTFILYFPAIFMRETGSGVITEKESAAEGGTETVLLAEDDPMTRDVVYEMLATLGYNVISTGSGPEAIEASREYNGKIHLLLTDVVMPKMDGKTLAETLLTEREDMKVIYMSGYPEDIMTTRGSLPAGIVLMEKPIVRKKLAGLLRNVLAQ